MSDSNKSTASSGPLIGLPTLLTGIFVAGKVFGYLPWSWWWVFCPLWISALAAIGFLLLCLLFFIGAWIFILVYEKATSP